MTGKSLFVVTGATGGFGSAILRQINLMYSDKAVIIAASRNHEKLATITKGFTSQIKPVTVDFSVRAGLTEKCQEMLDVCKDDAFDHVYLYNNHATVGDVKKMASDYDDPMELCDNYFLNVCSFQILTSVFIKSFPDIKHTCVNVSSIAGVVPIPSVSVYCAGKAARLMLYKVLALENTDINVFNYSPGPMKTDMAFDMMRNSVSPSVRDSFQTFEDTGTWADVDESSQKMLTIVRDGLYSPGQQIDFFDIVEGMS